MFTFAPVAPRAGDPIEFLRIAPEAVPAGFPSPAQGYYNGAIDLNQHLIEDPVSTFIMRVSGHSMTGAGIHDGDELVVNRKRPAQSGDIVVAVIDGEMTIKRLLRTPQGRIILKAENVDYPNIVVNEFADFSIWGVVDWCLHRV